MPTAGAVGMVSPAGLAKGTGGSARGAGRVIDIGLGKGTGTDAGLAIDPVSETIDNEIVMATPGRAALARLAKEDNGFIMASRRNPAGR